MRYKKPILKSLANIEVYESLGTLQTGYGQIIWQQTQRINSSQTYNCQITTNKFADAGVIKLEKKA